MGKTTQELINGRCCPNFKMGYDINPLKIIQEKKELLSKACSDGWILFFEHDVITEAAKVKKTEKGFEIREKVSLDSRI